MSPSASLSSALSRTTDEATCSSFIVRKGLSHEFFTFVPERLRRRRIERISAYSFARGADGQVVRHDIADVAVLAISASDFGSGSHDSGPYGSCGSPRNGLQLEGRLTLCRELLIHEFDHLFYMASVQVATQFGLNTSRMHGRSAHATIPVPFVEGNGKKNVGRLRAAIRDERFVGRPLKVGIFEVDVRKTVPCGRQVDQPSPCADKRPNPVHQDKMAQMIGAELRFKAVRGMAKRCGHHSRISDDHVEGLT